MPFSVIFLGIPQHESGNLLQVKRVLPNRNGVKTDTHIT